MRRIALIHPTIRLACEACRSRRAGFVVVRRGLPVAICARCRRMRGGALRARIVAA